MKLRYLDSRNCHALLPPVQDLPIARLLDMYLSQEINDKRGEQQGSIDSLVKRNECTINTHCGSQRLCNSPVEIALIYNMTSKQATFQGIARPISGPAFFHTILTVASGFTWKAIVPLQYLLKGWGDANSGYQCYLHSISHNMSHIRSFADMLERSVTSLDDYQYVGITGRNWLHRFREHMAEMGRGSTRLFHRAWRESIGMTDIHFISQLVEINLSYKDAMNWEELHVDRLGTHGLNMIPGGFKGLKFLYLHRIINRTDICIEERDAAITEYVRRNPRKGLPNPFISELWKDDQFYLKVIAARPKTLSPDQVRKTRELAEGGRSAAKIVEEVGALNEVQVKNVIAGRTYRRIH